MASYRIKDIVSFEGIRDNPIIGYGLVVGLNGTGDSQGNFVTKKGLEDFLGRMGVNSKGSTSLAAKNTAAVIVTANLPPFSRQGSRIDVTVSTLGDSKSLQYGTLLATPMLGADGQVYAVAQGQIIVGGFEATGSDGTKVTKNVLTNATIPNGGIIEQEIDFDLNSLSKIHLALRNPDVTTSLNIAKAINKELYGNFAVAKDPGTVVLTIPEDKKDSLVMLLAEIEQLTVTDDQPAKIVIDESSGTIVIGENVRIDPVAVAQGNLTISVTEKHKIVPQLPMAPPSPAGNDQKSSKISVDEEKDNKLAILRTGTTLKDLVRGLNALGIGPRDMITILQTIKSAGALQASLEVR
jgi:flagellar P-ring protein precursor FlgI